MPEVSIIVPVYNAEKYLHRCIDSILAQTFTDFELILIDDGSTDTSGEICDKYAKNNSRIRVMHQKNAGASSARNKGIEESVGKYLLFCDSDDFVHPQWCQILYDLAENNPDSLCVCNLLRTDSEIETYPIKETNCIYDITYFELYKIGLSGFAFNKIFNAKKIKDNKIYFPLGIPIGEDAIFVSGYIHEQAPIVFCEDILYYYNQNNDSAMHKYYSKWMEYHLKTFYCRIPLLDKNDITEFCDLILADLYHMFENVFDERNTMTFFEKMKYKK